LARLRRDFDGERRTAGLTVQFTPSERAELESGAQAGGLPIGAYIRELCLNRGAPVIVNTVRRNPEGKQLVDELRAIGINLNQIAWHANTYGAIDKPDDLRSALQILKHAMAHVLTL
jgi:hypothetical protein